MKKTNDDSEKAPNRDTSHFFQENYDAISIHKSNLDLIFSLQDQVKKNPLKFLGNRQIEAIEVQLQTGIR